MNACDSVFKTDCKSKKKCFSIPTFAKIFFKNANLTQKRMTRILGLGNALIDLITDIPGDECLNDLGLPKGSMTLVDARRAADITALTEKYPRTLKSGGSAANTIFGLARLGVHSGFIGKTGRDALGEHYENELVVSGILTRLVKSPTPTGRAIALISPDSERTFAVYLGAAMELSADDLQGSHFSGFDHLHIEGYLVQNHALMLKALELATQYGLTISLDLASYNVVAENHAFLMEIILKYVDMVFANEEEARSLTGLEPEPALEAIGLLCNTAIVKIGKEGSLIRRAGTTIRISATEARPVDTTGAGDIYAAGFLYGLSKGYDLGICGHLASLLAARVIEIKGARLGDDDWDELIPRINRMGEEA